MKDHRLSRWDSVTQPNLRDRPPMKDHRLSRWDSVTRPNPAVGDRNSCPFLSAFQACTSFLERFQGLRASRSPLATICRACGAPTTMFPTETHVPDQDSCSRPRLMFPTRTHAPDRDSCSRPGLMLPTRTHVPDQDSCSRPGLMFPTGTHVPDRDSCSRPGLMTEL
jgi:hypothetical protein